MPAIAPDPMPPCAAPRASAAAIGDVRDDEVTPLHRSLAALRGVAAGTRALPAAVDLAFAGVVGRACVAPAAGVAAVAATGAAPARAGAALEVLAVPVLALALRAGVRETVRSRTAPLAVAALTALEVDFAGASAVAVAGAAAVAADGPGAGASAGGTGAAVGAGVAATPAGLGAASGVAGVPKPAGVHAQASPAPTTATLRTDNTANPVMRTRVGTDSSSSSLDDDDL